MDLRVHLPDGQQMVVQCDSSTTAEEVDLPFLTVTCTKRMKPKFCASRLFKCERFTSKQV